MIGKKHAFVLALAFALACEAVALAQKNQPSAEVLFESARQVELVQGDLQAAIGMYQRVVKEAGNRALAAAALLRIGQCHERLGQIEARRVYERIVRDFADQVGPVTTARARLAALAEPPAPKVAQLSVRQVWAGPDVDATGSATSDGRFLPATDWTTGDIVVRELATGEMRHLRAGDIMKSGAHGLMPSFSPDDKQIAYAWYPGGSPVLYELRSVGANGSGERTLLHIDGGWIIPLAWSADSSQIAAVVDRPAPPALRQIVMVSAATGEVRVVKSGIAGALPDKLALSPDGRYLAYDARQPDGLRDIFVLDTRGSSDARLVGHPADDAGPVWMTDGKHVLFVSDRTGSPGLWSVEVADGKPVASPELLKPDIGRGFLPMSLTKSGALYYGLLTSMLEVYVATVDLAVPRVVDPLSVITQRGTGSNRYPAWSPDDRRLACVTKRGSAPGSGTTVAVRTMATDHEQVLDLPLGVIRRIAWFPDGKALVVTGLDGQRKPGIFKLDLVTGALTTLVALGDGTAVLPAQVTPDGKTLVYILFDTVTSIRTVRARDLATGEERVIAEPTLGSPSALALSPDGRHAVAFVTDKSKAFQSILTVPVSGGPAREVYRYNRLGVLGPDAAWSADGHIVFVARGSDDTAQLFVVSADGGTPSPLGLSLKGPRGLSTFSLHPDGKHIAVGAGETKAEVWVIENFMPAKK